MLLEPHEVWTRLLAQVKPSLSADVIRTWLDPVVPVSFANQVLTVSLPDRFSLEWTESKYASLLTGVAPVAIGEPVTLKFIVDSERQQRPQTDLFLATIEPLGGQDQAIKRPQLNSRYSFDHFVIGKSNELAAAAAQAVAQAPGRVYNPLFIYGSTGLGKTHLMQAIAHEVLEQDPASRVTYLSTEQFTNEMVASIQNRKNAEFRRKFRETDLLLVDDIHFLKGKESTQEEFFHTFNALYEAGRQIILTSDRPPSEIGGLEARLVSRFQWGMVADLEPPDVEHRIAILQHKAQVDHLEVTFPGDVLRYIAEIVNSSIRELEGSVIKVLAYASLRHRTIDVSLAQEALRISRPDISLSSDFSTTLSISAIQRAVAQVWNVTVEGLCSKARIQTLTIPRQLAMHIARNVLNSQLTEIGSAFGHRDHSTVIHSLARADELLKARPDLRVKYDNARSLLGIPRT